MKKVSKIISIFMAAVFSLSVFAVSASAVATPLTAGNTKETATNIPNDAVEFNGHYYKIYNISKFWTEAETYCKELGGHLCTITSIEEQQTIETLMKTGTKSAYWLGGRATDGIWQWTTGEDFTYSNWATYQPDTHHGTEDCLMIYKEPNPINESTFGSWNDLDNNCTCSDDPFFNKENFGFICEWDSVSDEPGDNNITDTKFDIMSILTAIWNFFVWFFNFIFSLFA